MNISIVGIIIVLVILIFIIRGWKIGLVKAVFDLLSFFIVGILTWIMYPGLAKLIISTPIYDFIHNWIITTLNSNDILTKSIPEFFMELPVFIKDSIVISSKQAFHSMINSTADALTILAINVISIILLFVALSLLALLIKKMGKFINKIIIVGPINMILGAFFGFLQGVFICYLVIMIFSYFPTTKAYDFIARDMEKSYVCDLMYNKNINILGFKPIHPINRGD